MEIKSKRKNIGRNKGFIMKCETCESASIEECTICDDRKNYYDIQDLKAIILDLREKNIKLGYDISDLRGKLLAIKTIMEV